MAAHFGSWVTLKDDSGGACEGKEKHQLQKVQPGVEGAYGHPSSSGRVRGEQGPCFDLQIFTRCICVQGSTRDTLVAHHTKPSLQTLLCKHLSACSHKPSFLHICKCKATPDMSVQGNEAKQTTCPSSGGKWNQQKLSCKGHPLPPTPSSPRHTDFSTALGIYDPYEIQHSCSPHLQQPTQPSFMPAGLRQNPKIMLQTNVEWCSTLLVSSQPTADNVLFF